MNLKDQINNTNINNPLFKEIKTSIYIENANIHRIFQVDPSFAPTFLNHLESLDETKKKPHKREKKICSSLEKRKAVERVLENNETIEDVAKDLNTEPRNVRNWLKKGKNNLVSIGKKTIDQAMEEKLCEFYVGYSKENQSSPDDLLLQKKAKEFSSNPRFKASQGWVRHFLKRNYLKLQIQTFSKPSPD